MSNEQATFDATTILEKIAVELENEANRIFHQACVNAANVAFLLKIIKGTKFTYEASQWNLKYGHCESFEADVPTLQLAHKLFGKLEKQRVVPVDSSDARKKDVWVYLNPVDKRFSGLIAFKYKRKVTRSDKCKIKREKSSYVTVVCDS